MLNKLANKTIYSVSEINKKARTTLETQIGNVYITGECSSIKVYQASGHWYLSLKDEHAQISCVMYRFQNQKLAHIPKVGDKLLVKGYITVYEARGSYQLIIDELQQEGIGKLYLAFEDMKAKLQKQGLFDQQHKKPIPT